MQIVRFEDVAREAAKEISQYQKGEKNIIKTGRPFLDDLFPVVNGSTILCAAQSGVGKSFELMRIKRNVLNKELNPDADNYVFLDISLEMKVRSLILREMSGKLKKSKKEILLQEFSEEEKIIVREYFKDVSDGRQYISQVPTSPTKYYNACKSFLEQHKDKASVFIAIDHLALVGADKGESRNQIIESLIERSNDLKMEFANVIFIFLSQSNSELIKRANDKDIKSQPQDSDIYYSQFSYQISDYVYVITNPLKMGIKEYTKIDPERYPNLKKYFLEPDNKGRVSLETYGVLYYHLLKCREADGMYLDIYAEDLNIPDLENRRKENKTEKISTEIPKFIVPNSNELPNFNPNTNAMTKAQGKDFDDNSPF